MTLAHVRKPLPRLGGNSFYRDKRDRTAHALTLCGAPVTTADCHIKEARKAAREGWNVCTSCLAALNETK